MIVILSKETFRQDPAQVLYVLCLKFMMSSAVGSYLPPLGGDQVQQKRAHNILGHLLDKLYQQLKRGIFMPGVGAFDTLSMAFLDSIVRPEGKFSFKLYVYMCYKCI